ncbi:MAG TPA: hypothetical protein VEK79_04400 [Thermoanaerobaculia bacterium]|nr:hypothetical protein [Thermoanaerobaculia bacterium]
MRERRASPFTFDDLPVVTDRDPLARQQRIMRDLLAHLKKRRLPVIGLVDRWALTRSVPDGFSRKPRTPEVPEGGRHRGMT